MAGEAEVGRMIIRLVGDASNYELALQRAMKATTKFANRVGKKVQSVDSVETWPLPLLASIKIIPLGLISRTVPVPPASETTSNG